MNRRISYSKEGDVCNVGGKLKIMAACCTFSYLFVVIVDKTSQSYCVDANVFYTTVISLHKRAFLHTM